MPILLFALAGCLLSCLLTAGVRSRAVSARLLDQPNERSSHIIPTPRGGGVAISVSFAALTLGLQAMGLIPSQFAWLFVGGAVPIAAIGLIDDMGHVKARWRFLAHMVVSVWIFWFLGGIPAVPIFGKAIDLGLFGLCLCIAYLVWMVNLYNFMDGIDGIASIQAITVSLGGALSWRLATGTPYWFIPLVFAACVAGFLIWNFPPAKIFMGDSGSGFVGIVLGILSLWTAQQAPQVFWCWFILLGCFMVDATTTLVRRVRRGEKFSEAHRSHAYQYASRKFKSHKKVTLFFGAINVVWLFPIALLVATGRLDGVTGTIVAYMPLAWLAFRFKAGVRAEQET